MENKMQKYKLNEVVWVVLGMIFVASTLRAPLTSVGPVIELIKSDLNISNSLAGLLTTIPLILFGMVSPFVSRIINRFTMTGTILSALCLLFIAILLRVSGDVGLFIFGTVLLGVAIAVGNVCLPSYVKWRFPLQIGLFTGMYSATMNLTAGLGGGLSYPLSQLTPLGYRLSLSFWIIFTILALMLWIGQFKKNKSQELQTNRASNQNIKAPKIKLMKSKLSWAVALTMAMQSMIFYTVIAWMPTILVDKGLSPTTAGYLLMLNQFSQVPMTFIFPIIASKMKNQKLLVTIVSLLFVIGFSFLFIDIYFFWVLGMIVAGFGMGAGFSLCMMFFSIRARTHVGSMTLSGFGQSIGYFIAAIGPFLIGLLHDVLGGWHIGIISLVVISILFYIVALQASTDRYVEDD
ncbi:MFS transporter [Mammaliicoccus sp. Dog046]|uniref:CynX/NimT family MFS transporter n=1 Tax=Mammaliicoccus sp. Dog046 TaxID=3034233 RepID=UPI002B25D1E3|nr:MFS transporter [Mammaliicoccus sp. Dog046]WQK85785.1 MFS transporter [Mammaliicoccus sp. Dog046]